MLPDLHVQILGRHALVVVRGHDYKHDLKMLRPYIREYDPVLIAVDGGADALLEAGFTPHIIIGDFDSCFRPRAALRRRTRCTTSMATASRPARRPVGCDRPRVHDDNRAEA